VVNKVHSAITLTNHENSSIPDTRSVPRDLSDGLTVVTAFFDIGGFQKGNGGSQFTPRLYRDWARVFARLESPTIIFVDSEEFRRYFAELRALHLRANLTVIRLLDRRQVFNATMFYRILERRFTISGRTVPYWSALRARTEHFIHQAKDLSASAQKMSCV